jgi:hypothetical protein
MSFKSKKEKMAKRKEKAKEDAKRSSSTLTLKDMLDNAKVSK